MSTIRDHAYYPLYWMGIDCAAFVQRVINAADPSTSNSITDPPDVKTTVMDLDEYEEKCAMNSKNDRAKRAWVEYFFVESNPVQRAYVSDIPQADGQNRVLKLRLLRKGDIIQYPAKSGISHVSMIYSDQPTCANLSDSTTCAYEIIHAYGSDCTTYQSDGSCAPGTFSRKVLTTPGNFTGFPSPTGFGRIKLWD